MKDWIYINNEKTYYKFNYNGFKIVSIVYNYKISYNGFLIFGTVYA